MKIYNWKGYFTLSAVLWGIVGKGVLTPHFKVTPHY